MNNLIESHKLSRYIKFKNGNIEFHLNNESISAKVDIEVKKDYISFVEGKIVNDMGIPQENILVKLEYFFEDKLYSYSCLTDIWGSYEFKFNFYIPSDFKINLYRNYITT